MEHLLYALYIIALIWATGFVVSLVGIFGQTLITGERTFSDPSGGLLNFFLTIVAIVSCAVWPYMVYRWLVDYMKNDNVEHRV